MENISQMSLLEVAIKLMEQKRGVQNIKNLITEVLEMKGLNDEDGSLAVQLYIDITTSSKFVYMGNEEWDLKIRQSLDEYESEEGFILKYVEPIEAMRTNLFESFGLDNKIMLEREAKVLQMLLIEGYFM